MPVLLIGCRHRFIRPAFLFGLIGPLGAILLPVQGWAQSTPAGAAKAAEVRSGAPASAIADQAGREPLTLEEAVRTALRQSPQVLIAVGNQQAAVARVGEARAAWLPQLTLSARGSSSYTYQVGLGDPSDVNCAPNCPVPGRTNLSYNGQLLLQQQLNDFGRTNGAIGQARAAARATGGDREAARQQIALSAMTGYFNALQADELYEVATQNLKQQQQKLLQAEGFFHIGTHAEIDVLTARTGKAQAQLQRVQAQNGIQIARAQLLLVLGVTDPAWLSRKLVPVERAALPMEGRTVDDLLDTVLKRRPDYQAQRDRVTVVEQAVRIARANYYPQINLTGSLGTSGQYGAVLLGGGGGGVTTANPATSGQPLLSASGTLAFTWQFFDGLQTPYAVKEKQALVQVAQASLEGLRQQVRSGLLQALMMVQNAREALQSAEVVQAQAELQLHAATGRYENGVGNIIELGDAQLALTTARSQRIQAEYALASSRAGLLQQLGELVEPEPGGRQK